jgi:DNA polymerase III alpha subunit
MGLSQLGELSRDFVQKIINKRKEKPYCDFRDFIQRVKPGLPEIRILIRSGALDTLCPGIPRPAMFWLYFHISAGNELFHLPHIPEFVTDYPRDVEIKDEAATLGVLISRHPLTLFSREIILKKKGKNGNGQTGAAGYPLITSREIPQYVNKKISIAGLVVTGKEVVTKDNEMMIFVSFEDSHSIFETVFFPAAFRRHHYILEGSQVYLIHGKVEEDQGALSINVESIEKLVTGDEEE